VSYFPSNQVHISGAGDYQLSKIEILKDPFPLNPRREQDLMDSDEGHDGEVLTIHFRY
jgi:pre-rRNA-processing protein TSR1